MNDTKNLLSFSSKDVDFSLERITEDFHHVARWCSSNQLLINPSETKFIVFGTRQFLTQVSKTRDTSESFLRQEFVPVLPVKDLGIVLDSITGYAPCFPSSLLSALYQISRVRHLFSRSVLLMILIRLYLAGKLFGYYIAQRFGLAPSSKTYKSCKWCKILSLLL